jgi:hypothetical protein
MVVKQYPSRITVAVAGVVRQQLVEMQLVVLHSQEMVEQEQPLLFQEFLQPMPVEAVVALLFKDRLVVLEVVEVVEMDQQQAQETHQTEPPIQEVEVGERIQFPEVTVALAVQASSS